MHPWQRACVLCLAAYSLTQAVRGADGVQITPQDGKLRVEVNGKLFTEFHHRGAPHVYYYPVIGPGGVNMTRHAPMKEAEGEDRDHPHHRSLWFSHGLVNGVDFWAETPRSGKIVNDKILEAKSGTSQGQIRALNKWVAPDGKVVCTEEQLFRVYARPDEERVVDFEITLMAGDRPVVLGDTKEGTMGIRVAESMRLKPNEHHRGNPPGRIVMSTGLQDGKTWGTRAAWCDYSGLAEGREVGVAIFDHPDNPRHPTWWHVRDYGLFAANPFGVHDFERKPAGTGDMTIAAGDLLTFRYRIYIHEGGAEAARVAERYERYAKDGSL